MLRIESLNDSVTYSGVPATGENLSWRRYMKGETAFVLTHESNPQRTEKSMSIIALAITRSLGRKGIAVVRIHPNLLDRSLTSKYCTKVEISPDFYASEKDLLAFLLAMKDRYEGTRLLIPGSDDIAYFVSKYHDALSGSFKVLAPDRAVMEIILDKKSQYEHAASLGIPIPETWFPAGSNDVRKLAAELTNYPYVIKPLVAHTWRRAAMKGVSQGKKGFAVHDAQAMISQYETIAQGDTNVMIQEVIGGSDERLFTFLSYFDEQSRPVAYCIRKKLRQLPVDFGYCTMGVSCHDDVVRDQSIRLLQGLDYHGISGVEWKHDPRTGQYKLIEVNPRAGSTIGIATASGVDLPYLAFRDKLHGSEKRTTAWLDGVKWIDFEQDFWAARELHKRGKLSLSDWWQSLVGQKTHAVYASDDIRPFVDYLFGFMKMRLVERWKRKLQPILLRSGIWAGRSLQRSETAKAAQTTTAAPR
jgi:predicted ATP-grasp superfamily ATP-dependent carboligase